MKLFPHQQAGVDWLVAHPRGGLFDDQGLGKTAQVICAADRLAARRILVVAPSVVAHNWKREFKLWSPARSVQVITEGAAKVDQRVSVVVVTHTLLLRERLMAQILDEVWDVAVLDEAHFFRNPKAKRSRAFYKLRSIDDAVSSRCKACWVLTGTPLPNNPSELWTMLCGLDIERLRDESGKVMNWQQFRTRFCKLAPTPYGDGWKVIGAQRVPELRERLKDFALRRMKRDVLDLPPIRFGTTLVEGTLPEELGEMEGSEDLADTRLARHIAEGLRTLGADGLRVGSQSTTTDEIAEAGATDLLDALQRSGSFSSWRRLTGIAKAPGTVELLDDELKNDVHKVVVFCHHVEVANILSHGLAHHGVVRITGDVPPALRQSAVDEFQTGRARVAVCQLVAGGTGVTLTAASDIVFVEQSFVPGENLQATDRVYRIGQSVPVLVRTLALAGSLDELVTEILMRKMQMIHEVLQ